MNSPTEIKPCRTLSCESGLNSRIEETVGFCVSCIEKMPKEIEELQQSLGIERSGMNDALKNYNQTKTLLDLRLALDEAERSGIEAAKKGIEESQCPFQEGTESAAMWIHGHAIENLSRGLAENQAVVVWAMTQLPVIRDLAMGTGQKEISDKLSFVIDKLYPIVSEYITYTEEPS